MALHALSEYEVKVSSKTENLALTIKSSDALDETFTITKENSILEQTTDVLNYVPEEVTISTSGSGCAVVIVSKNIN